MMQNRMSREICYSAIKMGEDELYHHGVLGMSWGDRNGPPYPLSGRAKKIARAEAKAKREKEKRLEKMRKMAAKKRKEAAKLQKKQDKINEMKKDLIMKGDIKAINKKRKYFTNEELQYALERNKQLVEAKFTRGVKDAMDPHAMEKAMMLVDRVGKIATAALPVVGIMKGMSELKTMRLNREAKEIEDQNKATKEHIELVKQFDPDAAAAMASRFTRTEVKNKGKSESEKKKEELSDLKERVDLLMKINPDEAAKLAGSKLGEEFKGMRYKEQVSAKDKATLVSSLEKLLSSEDKKTGSDRDEDAIKSYKDTIKELLKM